MNNNTLDLAVNVMGIMQYLRKKGVFNVKNLGDSGYILVDKKLFTEQFPDVESTDGEYLEAVYNGVHVVAEV